MNKVVARYADGRVVKGTTVDFSADRDTFHILAPNSLGGWDRATVLVKDLKALFYVKDLAGDPSHVDKREVCRPLPAGERAVGVTFRDGEVIVGTTHSYRVVGSGFFLTPLDAESNNERCFIPTAATQQISPIC